MKTYRCDTNKWNYSQLNNAINPHNTCNTTSMIQALDDAGFKLPGDEIFPKYKQPEDKLTYFCLTDQRVREYYKEKMPAMYNEWMKELKEKTKKTDITKIIWDSYPPNEVHAILSFATNLFMGTSCTTFHTDGTIEDIVNELKKEKPVVVSVVFGKLNHIVTIVGVNIDDNDKVDSFIIDDTYGHFNWQIKRYDGQTGNDNIISYDDMIGAMKPINNQNIKWYHSFKTPAAVI